MPELTVNGKKNILSSNHQNFNERQKELERQKKEDEEKEKREKNSPFSNFYQFNREHSKEMIWLATNYPKAQAILLFLLDQMDNYNAIICSYKVLQEALTMSSATITRSIKILKNKNFITILKSGTTNVYIVNKNLAWSSWGTNYKYAKFDAKILIAESEQELKQEKIKIKSLKRKEVTIEKKEDKI